jgi:hypothetical protein
MVGRFIEAPFVLRRPAPCDPTRSMVNPPVEAATTPVPSTSPARGRRVLLVGSVRDRGHEVRRPAVGASRWSTDRTHPRPDQEVSPASQAVEVPPEIGSAGRHRFRVESNCMPSSESLEGETRPTRASPSGAARGVSPSLTERAARIPAAERSTTVADPVRPVLPLTVPNPRFVPYIRPR